MQQALSAADRRAVTAAMMGSIFLAAMDVTAVAPAMPRIVGSLSGGPFYTWVFSIYMVVSTTTTLVFGRLCDRWGRKPVALTGIGFFLAGSVGCGLAPTMALLILARAVQGLGAGALFPAAYTVVGDLYRLEERARIQGYLSGVWGVASIVGPLVGGTLVATLGWRWVFFLNIPVGLVAAWLISTRLREHGYPRPGKELDMLGGTLFSGAVLLLLTGLKLAGPWRLAALAGCVGAAGLFVQRERGAAQPLFDLTLFRIPVFRAANASGLFGGAVLLSLSAFLPVYVMNARPGMSERPESALIAGLLLTPMSFGWLLGATVSGRLLARLGFRRLVLPGFLLLVLAVLGMSRLSDETAFPLIAALMVTTGISFGLTFTTFLVAVQEEVETERRGQATSAVQFFRQIGAALGIAVLELVFMARLEDPSLLEASAGQALDLAQRLDVLAGFQAAFLAASGFALLALVFGVLAPGRTARPSERPPAP